MLQNTIWRLRNSRFTYMCIAYSICKRKMDEETSMPFFQWRMKAVVDGRKSSIAGEMTLTKRLEARKWRIIVHARRWSTTGYRTVRIRRCVDADRLGFQSFYRVFSRVVGVAWFTQTRLVCQYEYLLLVHECLSLIQVIRNSESFCVFCSFHQGLFSMRWVGACIKSFFRFFFSFKIKDCQTC